MYHQQIEVNPMYMSPNSNNNIYNSVPAQQSHQEFADNNMISNKNMIMNQKLMAND